MSALRRLPFEQLPFATVDHHRALRCGHPEVIFCPGKMAVEVVEIARRLAADGDSVLATRASAEQIGALREAFADIAVSEAGRAALIHPPTVVERSVEQKHVALVSAGTADGPIAEEAAMTLRSMRVPVARLTDVGVSGLHRLLAQLEVLQNACAVIGGGRDGRGAAERGWGIGGLSGLCGADEHRVWSELRRNGRAAGDAE